jgi:hypothetical protein
MVLREKVLTNEEAKVVKEVNDDRDLRSQLLRLKLEVPE